MTEEPLNLKSTSWTELFGDSNRIRVIEAVVDLSLRTFDSEVLADQLPMDESEIQPHLEALASEGILRLSSDEGEYRYEYNNRNTVSQLLLELDRSLLTQSALQSDFDTLSDSSELFDEDSEDNGGRDGNTSTRDNESRECRYCSKGREVVPEIDEYLCPLCYSRLSGESVPVDLDEYR